MISDTVGDASTPNGGRAPRHVRLLWAVPALLLAAAVLAAIALPAPAATPGVPEFVQQVNKRAVATSLALAPTANITTGNRLVVQVGVWGAGSPSASGVTDSAGNTYTKVKGFKASDNTELSVWTAPIIAGGGTKPTVTVTTSARADIGAAVLEYSGLSTAAGLAAVDQTAQSTATTGAAAVVSAGPTPATTAAGELAIGFYADSGFSNTLAGDPTYNARTNVSPTGDMELLAQDQILTGTGATPNPTTNTGANTPWLAATVVFKTGAPAPPPTAPATPSAPTASAGDGQATVTWTAPDNGGSAITRYTVTPYVGAAAQTPKDVTGSPAPTSTTISGLTNGTAYTFKVSATNAIGTSTQSAESNAITPVTAPPTTLAFVQQVNKRGVAASLALQPTANISSGNRLIVEAGVWSAGNASASGVTDSAGNTYTKLTSFKASDNTELSVWSAPITAGSGTKPTITVTTTAGADIGATVLEYSGLSSAPGTGVVDVLKTATGKTSTAAAVSSGATAASNTAGELALGFYADSGFGNTLAGDPGYSVRTNVSPDQRHGAAGPGPRPVDRRHHRQRHDGHRREHDVAGRHHRLQDLGPGGAEPAQHAQRRHGLAGQRPGDRELDRARRRRQPDHEVHGHALRRRHRADADRRHRQPAGDDHDGHRPGQQHDLHVHGRGHQRDRHEPALGRLQPGHAGELAGRPVVGAHELADGRGALGPAQERQPAHLGRLAEPGADRGVERDLADLPDDHQRPGQHLLLGQRAPARRAHPHRRRLRHLHHGQPRPGRHDDLRSRRRGRGSASPT